MVRREFDDASSLEEVLAREVLSALHHAVNTKGKATILFSGGSTPKGLMKRLANSPFNWANVKVGLVDDRMVPAEHPESNALLLHSFFLNLITEHKPYFFPLVFSTDATLNMSLAMRSVEKLGIPDVVVLGMGNDGHFASLFPADIASLEGLGDDFNLPLLYTTAPVQPKNRISYSSRYLKCADRIFLHITGKTKLDIIDGRIRRKESLPIDTVLNDRAVKTEIFWAP